MLYYWWNEKLKLITFEMSLLDGFWWVYLFL